MSLDFYKEKEGDSNAKLTVQKTGRLGFSKGSMKMIGIGSDLYAKFGSNEKNELFLVIEKEKDEYSFKISKAGKYFYINARNLLKEMGIDYKSKNTIIFDLIKTDDNNVYKMKKRVIQKE